MPPSLCCCTCAYGRTELLARVVTCFESQDYDNKYLLILDDGWQFTPPEAIGDCHHTWLSDRACIVSIRPRQPALGAKRNLSVRLAKAIFPNITAFLPIDSDDLFMSWHLSASAAALEKSEWSRPSVVLSAHVFSNQWLFTQNYTGRKEDQTTQRMYHPSWAIHLDAFNRVGGYPENESGMEDKHLMEKLDAAGVAHADYCELGFQPGFAYCWEAGKSISSFLGAHDPTGSLAWAKLEKKLEPATLKPWTPSFDLSDPCILPGIRPRPF